jgi:cysteine desulfurase
MPVYLDHNATTPLDARVLEAMLPYLHEQFGNPSSPHRFGRRARTAIDGARAQVAALVNAHPAQVVFTSGGTEANNLALAGCTAAHARPGGVAIGATEHASVSEVAEVLAARGWQVTRVGVDRRGLIVREALAEVMRRARPVLVSIMYANNETGVIQDLAALATVVRAHGALLHSDAVQAAGKIAVDFAASGAQLMSLSGHKIYGPKGVGALIVDSSAELRPLLVGGGHEKGRRAGTENVAAIVGFGAAAELARARLAEQGLRLSGLRERLESGLRAIDGIEVFGHEAPRLPNTVYFGVPGVDGPTLLLALDKAGFACASGSACGSDRHEPSPALRAMGVEASLARSALRVSLGAGNTAQDVDGFISALAGQLQQLQRMARRAAG